MQRSPLLLPIARRAPRPARDTTPTGDGTSSSEECDDPHHRPLLLLPTMMVKTTGCSTAFAPSSSSSSSNGGLKSIDDLLKEIENGETVLEENNTEDTPGGDVSCVRRVSVVVVEITSKSKPNKKLIEYVQTLPSGATRKRERFLSEKIMTGKGEGPLEAAERGIREELGAALSPTATIRIDKNSLLVKEEFATSSLSYRRLPTRYRFYEVKAEIEGLPVDEDTFASEETCGTKAVWKWV
mmetsp:Transcript_1888/g.5712  ORF Transcript_1888/g.5712 Transcript_1888/m.5712 type:complete len:240 (+) Transcript_1888:1941-2660(+)